MITKEPISKFALISLALKEMEAHELYLEGMTIDDVSQKAGVLIFRGNFFLDEQGLPTEKTPNVFNIYKYLAQNLSKTYQLL